MNSIRAELRFKNAILWRAIFSSSKSVAMFSRDYEFGRGVVGAFLNLKSSPYTKNGEPKKSAKALCSTLGLSMRELFPMNLYSGSIPSGVLALEVGPERFLSCSSPEALLLSDGGASERAIADEVDRDRLRHAMTGALSTLRPREKIVIQAIFFEGRTLRDVGRELCVSPERARQIEIQALRKLRHPSRSRGLKHFQISAGTGNAER